MAKQVGRAQPQTAAQVPIPQSPPTPIPAPIPDDVDDDPSTFVATPKEPLWDQFLSAVVNSKAAAIDAYRELPEWAQPITWGLAAGSALSIIGMLVMLLKR